MIHYFLLKTVFTIDERQQQHLIINDDIDKESYIDQIDARSLDQRVELPIPDEEPTTTKIMEPCKFLFSSPQNIIKHLLFIH